MTVTDWETQPRQDRRAGKINTRDSTIRLSRSERFSQGENSISNWAEVIDCLSLSVQYCKAGEKKSFYLCYDCYYSTDQDGSNSRRCKTKIKRFE